MSEFKNFISGIILLCILCTSCFFGGYIFCDRNAAKRIEDANNQLTEQQRKYDELIRETEERIKQSEDRVREANKRISDIRAELLGKVSDNGETTKELSRIIEQIEKQRITI